MEQRYFDYNEVARLLSVSRRSVERIVDAGHLRATYLRPRCPRIHVSEIQAYEKRLSLKYAAEGAGPSTPEGEMDVCSVKRTVSTKGKTRPTGGQAMSTGRTPVLDGLLTSGRKQG